MTGIVPHRFSYVLQYTRQVNENTQNKKQKKTPGKVHFTDDELAMVPPHRVEHRISVSHRGSGSSATPVRGGGGVGRAATVAGSAHHSLLALAMHVSWPEDPETSEGMLVETVLDEQHPAQKRAEALKVLLVGWLRAISSLGPGGQRWN